jgi:hypothetical protein
LQYSAQFKLPQEIREKEDLVGAILDRVTLACV